MVTREVADSPVGLLFAASKSMRQRSISTVPHMYTKGGPLCREKARIEKQYLTSGRHNGTDDGVLPMTVLCQVWKRCWWTTGALALKAFAFKGLEPFCYGSALNCFEFPDATGERKPKDERRERRNDAATVVQRHGAATFAVLVAAAPSPALTSAQSFFLALLAAVLQCLLFAAAPRCDVTQGFGYCLT